MMLTFHEDYDKFTGKNLPMISRAGKSTLNMYIAFSQGKREFNPYTNETDDSLSDSDQKEANPLT